MAIVRVENLNKSFNDLKAVDNISFSIEKKEIFGLLGPNGAGKTTTIRMLTGILKPSSGKAYINNYDIQKFPLKARKIMGIVPEMANAYIDLSAIKNLLLMGELYGITKEKRIKKADYLLKLFHLYEYKDKKVKTFSKGMKQRVILGMAFMSNPKILFLDEPTTGLDVESVRLIRHLIKEFNQKGIAIVLTTHNIEEANLLCDRVAIMNKGKIMAIDRPEILKKTIQKTSSVKVAFEKQVNEQELLFKNANEITREGDKFRIYTQETHSVISSLIKYANSSHNKIISLNTLDPSLEDVFIKLTKKNDF
jgi:ABC-2 type transport system ATP-binding protein